MDLAHALRLDSPESATLTISVAGAGGKTTALFKLARQLGASRPVLVTATSHLGAWQIPLADHHLIVHDPADLKNMPAQGVILITGEIENERTKPVNEAVLYWLHEKSKFSGFPLLIEADGSRQKPLKAPADHEPPIPPFSDVVIYVAGLGRLGKPLHEENIHRAEIFSHLSGAPAGIPVTPQALTSVLIHPNGGLKNLPPGARRIILLNQAETPELRSMGGKMARELIHHFDAALVGSLHEDSFHTVEPPAGIILAAGSSARFGSPKQLLDWKGKPFVRHVTETALHSGLEPVVVVTGHHHAEVESAVADLPVKLVHNPEHAAGQSTSIRAGLGALPKKSGSAIFFLADQPQIPVEVVRALTEAHTESLSPIVAPLVLEERRANPVLFDKSTFRDLLAITGDKGGRAIFDKHRVEYLPWHDDILLFDVDTPEDYARLKSMDSE